jgi:hypothetical protein
MLKLGKIPNGVNLSDFYKAIQFSYYRIDAAFFPKEERMVYDKNTVNGFFKGFTNQRVKRILINYE